MGLRPSYEAVELKCYLCAGLGCSSAALFQGEAEKPLLRGLRGAGAGLRTLHVQIGRHLPPHTYILKAVSASVRGHTAHEPGRPLGGWQRNRM